MGEPGAGLCAPPEEGEDRAPAASQDLQTRLRLARLTHTGQGVPATSPVSQQRAPPWPRRSWSRPPTAARAGPVSPGRPLAATRQNCFREVNYMAPQTRVNKMKKFLIYSCCLRILPPSSGRIKRTSKQPGFQLSQCDHPRDAGIFL